MSEFILVHRTEKWCKGSCVLRKSDVEYAKIGNGQTMLFTKREEYMYVSETPDEIMALLEEKPAPAHIEGEILWDAVLCYVSQSHRCYFTTAPLNEQWGDDWNDAPYDCNAGQPYVETGHKIQICFVDGMATPADDCYGNTPYSVEDINGGKVAWLSGSTGNIFAGITLRDFIPAVYAAGGKVYMEPIMLHPTQPQDVPSSDGEVGR